MSTKNNCTMFVIRSKEGNFWRKGTMGNPTWTSTLCVLCLHDNREDADKTLAHVKNRPEFADYVMRSNPPPNTEPIIAEVNVVVQS